MPIPDPEKSFPQAAICNHIPSTGVYKMTFILLLSWVDTWEIPPHIIRIW